MPFGKKQSLKIFDRDNILAVNKALQNVDLICGDYTNCERLITDRSFVFFDPPYRPVAKSGYLKYAALPFTDVDQIQLSDFYKKADDVGAYTMLSNSCSNDGFLEQSRTRDFCLAHHVKRMYIF